MNFTTATKCQSVIRQGDDVARIQSANRSKVDNLFNGFPPLSEAEATKANIRVNVNWGEAARIAQLGTRQYKTAFLGPKNFFRVTLPNAPVEKADDWGIFITKAINKLMKKNKKYVHTHKYKWASVLLHGIGPTLWYDKESWCPNYIALADLRIPTNTTTDFENLNWFAVRHQYTVYSLAKKAFGENADPCWIKAPVSKLLANRIDINYDSGNSNEWLVNPEKMSELVKQNGMYYQSDAVPTIPLWHFFYLDDTDLTNPCWNMTVIPDVVGGATALPETEFLYKSDKPFADELSRLLHCQFGDLNVVSPTNYHSVRALGFELMEPCFYSNLTRCRYLQHVHESFNIWLRITDPTGRARAQKVEMYDRCVIPEGVSIVPQDQRHSIPAEQVESVLGQMRQLEGESGTAYTQDIHEPGDEGETATKTNAKERLANQVLGGLLEDAFGQELSSYEEIARRFCLSNSSNPDAKKFQKQCKDYGIDRVFVNADQWDIEAEIPMGSGNQSLALAQANGEMAVRPMLDPTAQQDVLHNYLAVNSGNPRRAERLAPLSSQRGVTSGIERAESIFGTLMTGFPARLKEGINPIEIIDTLLPAMAAVISRIETQGGNMATSQEVAGLKNTGEYVGQLIDQLAQNPQEEQRVKQYGDAMGKLMNSVKGFEQRLAEMQDQAGKESLSLNYKDAPPSIQRQMESRAGFKPAMETEAQVDPKTLKAVHSAAVKDRGAQQKAEHQQVAFDQDQARKDFELKAEMEREAVRTAAEVERAKKVAEATPKEPAPAA